LFVFFFFQAEDGIRDGHVTGVQTCALPILLWFLDAVLPRLRSSIPSARLLIVGAHPRPGLLALCQKIEGVEVTGYVLDLQALFEIGRASCRERVEMWEVAGVGERRTRYGV